MRFLDADSVAACGYATAIAAISSAIDSGVAAAAGPSRTVLDLPTGQLLLMPAHLPDAAGVKIVTVAPDNPARGLPRIAAAYVAIDPVTLQLTAVLDGAALTTLRTPAVSVAAVLPWLPSTPLRVAVFGAGPQAAGHVAALQAVRQVGNTHFIVRDPGRGGRAALAAGSEQAARALAHADVVVCATTARSPVFDSHAVRDDAVVIAVGSHEPDARELDAALLARSTVLVEDVATAMREAGDVVLAVADGALREADLVPLAARSTAQRHGPLVFKSVGMAWQDVVVAQAVLAHAQAC